MLKYSEQFKLSVVRQYLRGTDGYVKVAEQHGLRHSMVQRWVAVYRIHGKEGLKRKASRYSAEFKLSVLQRMWADGLSRTQVAALFNIRGSGHIGMWERDYRRGGLDALIARNRGQPKPEQMATPPTKPDSSSSSSDDEKRTHEELLAELKYLRMENAYLKKLRALVQAQSKATSPKKRK